MHFATTREIFQSRDEEKNRAHVLGNIFLPPAAAGIRWQTAAAVLIQEKFVRSLVL